MTDQGTVKIEVNDPTALVRVDGQEIRIENRDEPITLRAGDHLLEVNRGDHEVETKKFTVRRGDRNVRVTFTPKPPEVAKVAKAETQPSFGTNPKPGAARSPSSARMPNSVGMMMVRIEPGTFTMGSNESDDEKPPHTVRITKPFYLAAHEVTQGQYQAVMGENPSFFKGSDDLPVERVSWLDAVRFCNTLSEREKRKPCYQINGERGHHCRG